MAVKTKRKRVGGRPRNPGGPLSLVNFRADAAVLDAIDRLAAALDMPGVVAAGARSVAIRRALLEAAARLDAKDGAQ